MRYACFLCAFSLVALHAEPIDLNSTQIVAMDKRGAPEQKPLWHSNWKQLHCANDSARSKRYLIAAESSALPVDGGVQEAAFNLDSGKPCEPKGLGSIWINGSLLLWQAKMWGLECASKWITPSHEKTYVPDFSWCPGFKIDLGYDFVFDGWSLEGRWTCYDGNDTHLKKHIHATASPSGLGIGPLWFYPFYTISDTSKLRFEDSKMSWDIAFNAIDVELGRLAAFNRYVSARLFTGLKTAWFDQDYHVFYKDGIEISATLPNTSSPVLLIPTKSKIRFHNSTVGGGPRIGLDTKWKCGYGFSVITNSALSLLYAQVKTHRKQIDETFNVSTQSTTPWNLHLHTLSHQMQPVAEVALGANWESCISSRSIIAFSLAYELQYWWAQNGLRRNYSYAAPGSMFPMRGDLQMHGLTTTAAYYY